MPMCDEDRFCKFDSDVGQGALRIFSLNIRKLPKHKGELLAYLSIWPSCFHRTLGKKYRLNSQSFWWLYFLCILPNKNVYGGVGIYVSDSLNDVFLTNSQFKKTCTCSGYEIESLVIDFTHCGSNIQYIRVIPTPEWRCVTFHKRLGTYD